MRPAAIRTAITAWILLLAASVAAANPLEPGWTLDPDLSNLRFQSTKNTTKVETSSFATFSGEIAPDGTAEIRVLLDSVDTGIDIRNVRMRFLFFETFNYPEAIITARIDPGRLDDLQKDKRTTFKLPFSIDLHGVKKTMIAEVVATLLTEDLVSVASTVPITVPVQEFGLLENLGKLEEAAGGVTIIPSGGVSFDFLFNRNGSSEQAPAVADAGADALAAPSDAALEPKGDFSVEACVGRFETMSRAGNITFASNSATINGTSAGLLSSLAATVKRCPDLVIEVGGHTDNDGSKVWNQTLSEQRAAAVRQYLVDQGIEPDRLVAVGYGEEKPMVPNTSWENKSRNRRIEFTVLREGL